MTTKYAIASDHAGYELKQKIIQKYADQIEWLDLGTHNAESVDYPDFGAAMGQAISDGDVSQGILVCGSGIGISIAANRFSAVRAALCTSDEMAMLARQHNDANVLALGARMSDEQEIFKIIDVFMGTAFEGGRHERRRDKLTALGQ